MLIQSSWVTTAIITQNRNFVFDFANLTINFSSMTSVDMKLPRLTVGFGLLAWLGFFLATAGLVMFYRCSRLAYLPPYYSMS